MDLRVNEILQTGRVRKTKLPFYRLVGAVSNSAYAVRLETAPTGGNSVIVVDAPQMLRDVQTLFLMHHASRLPVFAHHVSLIRYRVIKNLRPLHNPSFSRWKALSAVHGTSVVPYDQIADLPVMRPDKTFLRQMIEECTK